MVIRFPVVRSTLLAPIARRRGYRATYPLLSRTTIAPRVPRDTR